MTEELAIYSPNQIAASGGIQGAEWLTPGSFAQAQEIAKIMAKSDLVPDHLKNKPENCLPILVQACRWRIDPFAVAQATSVVRGKLCYEGKLVHSVLIAMGAIEGRLSYKYEGEGQNRKITVSGRIKGDSEISTISGTVQQWATDNQFWKKDPDTMLAYRGARQWARLYCPDAMLGIQTPDEVLATPTREVHASVVDAEPQRARIREVEPDEAAQDENLGDICDEKKTVAEMYPEEYKAAKEALMSLWKAGKKEDCKNMLLQYGCDNIDQLSELLPLLEIAMKCKQLKRLGESEAVNETK